MFSLIAGNCVIESEETVMETAEQLKEITEELQIFKSVLELTILKMLELLVVIILFLK